MTVLRRLAGLAGLVVLLLTLTGCFEYETTATIDEQGLVTGSVVIGYGPELIDFGRRDGRDPIGELERFLRSNAAKVSRGSASVRPYAAGRIRGFETTFAKVAPSDFVKLMRHEAATAETAGVEYRLTRTGDTLTFLARLVVKKGQIPLPPEAFKDADVRISLTFPGEVVAANGSISGRTVTWRPNLATVPRLTATAKLPATHQPTATPAASAGSGFNLLWVVVPAVMLALAAGFLFVRRQAGR